MQNNSNQGQSQGQSMTPPRNPNQEKDFVYFTPIPMTYTKLLPNLISNGLVVVCPVKPLQLSYPKGYDANVKCDYHGGAAGHSTERCLSFKRKVQSFRPQPFQHVVVRDPLGSVQDLSLTFTFQHVMIRDPLG